METQQDRQDQLAFAKKVKDHYIPRLVKKETMLKSSREFNTEMKELNNEIKEMDEDLKTIMQSKKWKYFTCQEHMHLCICTSKRKRTLNQSQLIEVCMNYIVGTFMPTLEKRVNNMVMDITKQNHDIKIPCNATDITLGLEQAVNTARSNPMQEKVELKIKKQRPNI
jgi:hypothetical protein